MQLLKNFVFGQCIIFYYEITFVLSKPMVGENIEVASEEEFPYAAAILRIDGKPEQDFGLICTGTLISNQNVLTSEHCLEDETTDTIHVSIGSIDFRRGTKYNVLSWKTYNEWAEHNVIALEFSENDIAVMKLTQRVHEGIRPVIISPMLSINLFGLEVTMIGWGESNSGQIPTILEKTSVKIVPNRECEDRVASFGIVGFPAPVMVLCTASQPYALLHRGDSGGPLLYRDELVGVHSGTVPLPEQPIHPEKLNVHFSVYYYRIFILDMIYHH